MFYEQLKKACKEKNTTITAVLKKIGVGLSKGKCVNTGFEQFFKKKQKNLEIRKNT